ncbi:hypothetical protein [Pseudomonas sp. O230]|uniref:hypothetical protein n=1 Tax=Pseudomonas sp. O230 TaxID=3159450 RepID=UPI00387AE050
MKENLSEEEMRQALFGPSKNNESEPENTPEEPASPDAPPWKVVKSLSPKLRVTLRVSKEFEGNTELFTYDANTLSTFVAEQSAKAEAKKKKFKYFELVSIKPS